MFNLFPTGNKAVGNSFLYYDALCKYFFNKTDVDQAVAFLPVTGLTQQHVKI